MDISELMNELGEIAMNYGEGSKYELALKTAAIGLFFIEKNNDIDEFKSFVDSFGKKLTKEEIDNLKKLGLDYKK